MEGKGSENTQEKVVPMEEIQILSIHKEALVETLRKEGRLVVEKMVVPEAVTEEGDDLE